MFDNRSSDIPVNCVWYISWVVFPISLFSRIPRDLLSLLRNSFVSISVRRWSFYPVANSNLWPFQALSAPVLAAVGERYYKVTAEALRVCGELVKAIRPNFDNVRISC